MPETSTNEMTIVPGGRLALSTECQSQKKTSLPLDVLLELMHREAVVVTWQIRMLTEGKVCDGGVLGSSK